MKERKKKKRAGKKERKKKEEKKKEEKKKEEKKLDHFCDDVSEECTEQKKCHISIIHQLRRKVCFDSFFPRLSLFLLFFFLSLSHYSTNSQ